MISGIDLSEFNIVTDWKKVKKQTDFVILRAGYGKYSSQIDARFFEYAKAASELDMHIGAYWYTYAKNEEEAREEAKLFVDTIKSTGIYFRYPLFVDVEEKTLTSNPAQLTNIVYAFCEYLESAGYYAGIYCNLEFATKRMNLANSPYDLWVADYSNFESCKYPHNMWQHSDEGKIDGVSGKVDLDYDFVGLNTVIVKKGLNNPPVPGQAEKSDLKTYVKNFVESVKNLI